METSLHRELKSFYAGPDARFEVPWGKYRVDVVDGERLIEIQHGSLGAIRDKVRELLVAHEVVVVKPIIATKTLLRQSERGGEVLKKRRSPKRGQLIDIFDDLIRFTRVFPHRRLTLDVLLVDVDEYRYPGHGRRRRWRENDHQIEDQKLVCVHEKHRFRTAADLVGLLNCRLPKPFDTGDLAKSMKIARWRAQRIAYCLDRMGGVAQVGKRGNARLFEFCTPPKKRRKTSGPR